MYCVHACFAVDGFLVRPLDHCITVYWPCFDSYMALSVSLALYCIPLRCIFCTFLSCLVFFVVLLFTVYFLDFLAFWIQLQ